MFKHNSKEGLYFPFSIKLIVCLVTPTFSANCCCVKSNWTRAILILLTANLQPPSPSIVTYILHDSLYPALTGSNIPPQDSEKSVEVRWG